jgi:LPS O-antigen subunit length determinant protein (WzzB/FepE family)
VNQETQAPNYNDDEIDLFELFETIWKEKVTVFLVTVLFAVGGAGYAFLSKPVYEAEIILESPQANELSPLDTISFASIKGLFSVENLVNKLESTTFKNSFIESNLEKLEGFDALSVEERTRSFNDMYTVERLGSEKEPSLYPFKVATNSSDPTSAEWLLNNLVADATLDIVNDAKTQYIDLKEQKIEQLSLQKSLLEEELKALRFDEIKRIEESDDLKLAELNDQLKVKVEQYYRKLDDQIRSLEEALAISEALGIEDPVALDRLSRKSSEQPNSQVAVEVVSDRGSDPLYLRGSRLLGAELAQLKSRPVDYIPSAEIRDLQAQIALLENNRKVEALEARQSDEAFSDKLQTIRAQLVQLGIETFPNSLTVDMTNGVAVANPAPIKPKRMLIVALSIVLGGMLGLVIALIRGAARKRKAKAA